MSNSSSHLGRFVRFAVIAAAVLGANLTTGANEFIFSFEGPDALWVDPGGGAVGGTFACTLAHRGGGPGAQGWSFGVAVPENARITGIGFEGTDAARVFQGGFEKSELVTQPSGSVVAVSAVTLGSGGTLPANATQSIAFITLEYDLALPGHRTWLEYRHATVFQAGEFRLFRVDSKAVLVKPRCFGASDLSVGFSGRPISSPVPHEGILGDPAGSDGEMVVRAPEGKEGTAHVYANIITDSIVPEGPQGWSFSVRLEGEAGLTAVTTDGTSVDKYMQEGFNITLIAEQRGGGSRPGAVTAVALSVSGFPAYLPRTGTESVLDMRIDSWNLERGQDRVATLWFQDGLTGRGQPVANVITVDGQSASVCNFGFARVHVRFTPLEEALFIRGNSNGDSRVDISDAIWILNELFLSGAPSPCQEAADVNDDGVIDTSDAVQLVHHQFLAGPAPRPPFPLCGSVPEEGRLSCPEAQAACY